MITLAVYTHRSSDDSQHRPASRWEQVSKTARSIASHCFSAIKAPFRWGGVRRVQVTTTIRENGSDPKLSKSASDFMKAEGFQFGRPLGRGKFSKVYCVTKDNKAYAFKELIPKKMEEKWREVEGERGEYLGFQLRGNSNLLHIVGFVIMENGNYRYVTEEQECLSGGVVMGVLSEFVPNARTLKEFMDKNSLTEKEIQTIGRWVGEGLAAMHKRGIYHRDIKPENLLVDTKNLKVGKIIDNGFARQKIGSSQPNTRCGALAFMAPEVMNKTGHTEKADAWSFGVLLYEMRYGKLPFTNPEKEVPKFIAKKRKIKTKENTAFKELINKLICAESERLTVEEALKHRFFTGKAA